MKIKEGGGMDVQEKKAFEIAFDNKLGARGCQFDLDEDGNYEDRETLCGWHMWLEAKAQAVPDQLDVNSILHDIDCYFDNGLSNTERTANNLLQSIYEKLSGEVKAQEPTND